MSVPPMTPVLIARTMTRTLPNGVTSQCSISFGTPALYPELSSATVTMYYCPFQLSGFQDNNVYISAGEDPLEALILALCMAGTRLHTSLAAPQLNEWDASTNFGFPVIPDYVLQLANQN